MDNKTYRVRAILPPPDGDLKSDNGYTDYYCRPQMDKFGKIFEVRKHDTNNWYISMDEEECNYHKSWLKFLDGDPDTESTTEKKDTQSRIYQVVYRCDQNASDYNGNPSNWFGEDSYILGETLQKRTCDRIQYFVNCIGEPVVQVFTGGNLYCEIPINSVSRVYYDISSV